MIKGPYYATYPYNFEMHYFDAIGVSNIPESSTPMSKASVQGNVPSSATGNPKFKTLEAYNAAVAARVAGR